MAFPANVPNSLEPEKVVDEFAAQPNSRPAMPTAEAYGQWQGLFSILNEQLFDGALPNCLITLTRHPGALGYFCPGRFEDRDGRLAHEISLNPEHFASYGDAAAIGVLAHEMCHQWRHDFGALNRKGGRGVGGYHDRVWADRMEAIGLMPSSTGKPGGKRTGYHMSHYVIDGGRFDLTCRELIGAGHAIAWRDASTESNATREESDDDEPAAERPAQRRSRNTRTKFVCPTCDVRVWSRASAQLACLPCELPLVAG